MNLTLRNGLVIPLWASVDPLEVERLYRPSLRPPTTFNCRCVALPIIHEPKRYDNPRSVNFWGTK